MLDVRWAYDWLIGTLGKATMKGACYFWGLKG